MDKEIKKLIDKYIYDKGLQKYSNKHFFDDHVYFGQIKENKDIDFAYNRVLNTIQSYEKVYPLVSEDIEDLEKLLGKYEIALHKVLQCFDSCNFDYSATELKQLINNREILEDKINNIHIRKMYQD